MTGAEVRNQGMLHSRVSRLLFFDKYNDANG